MHWPVSGKQCMGGGMAATGAGAEATASSPSASSTIPMRRCMNAPFGMNYQNTTYAAAVRPKRSRRAGKLLLRRRLRKPCHLWSILCHHLRQQIQRQRVNGATLIASHRIGGRQSVQDRLFDRVGGGDEQTVHLLV